MNAIKLEAQSKPDEKIFVCKRWLTFKEFAEMINHRGQLRTKEEKQIVKSCLNNFKKLFRENESYRQKVMSLAGTE